MAEENECTKYYHSFDDGGKTQWTKEMVKRLIDMYKERQCLYDSKIASSREQRTACIREISVTLGVSGLFAFPS